MFYFKRLIHSLFALTIIIGLSACSPNTPTKSTKEATKEITKKPVKKEVKEVVKTPKTKAKTQSEAVMKVNQELEALFTPAIGLF